METVKFDQTVLEVTKPKKHYLFDSQFNVRKTPKGYMTGEEFVRRGIENINQFCKENGLL